MIRPLDIRPDHLEIVKSILGEHLSPEVQVWIFGSRADWLTKDSSDLDIALEGKRELSQELLGILKSSFEDSALPFSVDIVDLNRVGEPFRRVVESQRIPLPIGGNGVRRNVKMNGFSTKSDNNSHTSPSTLPSDWREVTLGDHIVINDSTYSPKEAWPHVNYLDTGNIKENRIEEVQSLVPGVDEIPSRARRKVQPGDILYSTVRPNQRHYGLLRALPDHFLASTGFAVLRGNDETTDTDYIYWFLTGDEVVEYLHSIAETSTSAYPSIKPSDLERLTIPLPPLQEQRAIAHVLGTLDDKIELNRRMNETLEAMARALFTSWFVDFEPVRAKIDGRWRRGESLPGLPADLWDLFPDRLVPSQLGDIPEGWEVKALGDAYGLTMGQSPPGHTYNESGEGLPFFQGNADFAFRFPDRRKYCTEPSRLARPNDTLVSVRAPVGAINMAWEECCIGRGVAALRHKSDSTTFTYYSARALQVAIQEFDNMGTVFGAITGKQFKDLEVIEPSSEAVEAFESVVRSTDGQIRRHTAESRALAAQRDALLPRLVSGEVRV